MSGSLSSTLTSPTSSTPSTRPSWMSAWSVVTTSTVACGCASRRSRTAGTSSVDVAAPTVPTRTVRVAAEPSSAAVRNLATDSRTSTMKGWRSRPRRLIRAPERRRSSANQDLDASALRAAFGVFPSGVVAVAAEVDGALVGLAASSFTSVILDPPLVSFSVANTSKTWPDLRSAGHLGLTILADHHDTVCRQLAGPVEQRFDDVPVAATAEGAVTVDGGLARFDCTIYREVEAGDHTIVLLRLHAVDQQAATDAGLLPLVFHRSGFGTLAASA